METTDRTRDNTRSDGGARLPVDAADLDLNKYRALAGDVEVSDEEFDEFLRTLHAIMSAFVQNAWDVRVIPAFLPEIFDDASARRGGAIDSDDEEDTDDEA